MLQNKREQLIWENLSNIFQSSQQPKLTDEGPKSLENSQFDL